MLRSAIKHFCLNTCLHGCKFIFLPRRALLERVIWTVVSISALVGAVVLSYQAWYNFKRNSVITITDSTHNSIWNYHFPAVTICNVNKISAGAVEKLIRNLTLPQHINISKEQLNKEFQLLHQLIDSNNNTPHQEQLMRLQDILDYNHLPVEDVLQKVSPACEILGCKWKGAEIRCGSIFETMKTSFGFCCSFNYFGIKNHTFKGEAPLKAPKKPRRVSACGYKTALEVTVANNISDYHTTSDPLYGYKILIHHPYEFPDWSTNFMLASEKSITFISSTPTLTYATEAIHSMDVSVRKCLLQKERPLKIYSRYNYRNCISECRMELFKKYCKCVPFFYFNEEVSTKNATWKVCNLRDVECLNNFKPKIILSSISYGFDYNLLPENYKIDNLELCSHCYPDCEYNEYPFEGSAGGLEVQHSNEIHVKKFSSLYNNTLIKVFFNDLVGNRNRTDVYYNWHKLLALFGGILGVFIGFSFVGVFEVIYIFIIHTIFAKNIEPKDAKAKNKKLKKKNSFLDNQFY